MLWAISSVFLSAGAVAPIWAGQTNLFDTIKQRYEQTVAKVDWDIYGVYSNNVASMIAQFKKDGNFEACVVLMEEQKNLSSLPVVPTGETRKELVAKVSGYGEMIRKVDADRAQRLLQVQRVYAAKLDALIKDLMAADDMNEAKRVNDEKTRIAQLIATAEPVPAPTPDPWAMPPADSRQSPVRQTDKPTTIDQPAGSEPAPATRKITRDLLIVKATLTHKYDKSQDVTEVLRRAVKDNELVIEDWHELVGRKSGYTLMIQYRFGSQMMRSMQCKSGTPVYVTDDKP